MEEFSASVDTDSRLYREDIEGSIAHVRMLARRKILSQEEAKEIINALREIKKEIEVGTFHWRLELEDIHLNIERRLIEKIGNIGGKLHTARSRNDQIALDLRLYLRHETEDILSLIKNLASAFLELAEKNSDAIMPGYTHLQRAQPVLFSHHILAYFEMLKRDRERFLDCLKRINIMPLGAGALAGTSFPIDRKYVAGLLRFPDVARNSIDAVSDRDFVVEFLSTSSILMMHLSRFSEELVLWSTKEFDFIDLGDEFTTGSSIMPQKRNPDVAELIRGKVGRVYGSLFALLTTLKGLPLSYNRDLQEDKEPLFDAIDTVKDCLETIEAAISNLRIKPDNMRRVLEGGFVTATDLADYLTRKGVPFRTAHEVAGRVVRYAEEEGKELWDLSLDKLKRFSRKFEGDVFDKITIEGSISSKKSYGGTSGKNVLRMIKEVKKEISKW